MYKLVFVLIIALVWGSVQGSRTVNSHLDDKDLGRLQRVFVDGLNSNDLQSIFYASLNIEPSNADGRATICKQIRTFHQESKLNDFEKDFYLVGANKNLRCSEKLSESLLASVYASVRSTNIASVQELYYRVATHKLLGVQIDETVKGKLLKSLQDILKKDDSLVSLGYAFNVAAELGPGSEFAADRVEDAFVQADEVDGRMLQFEGGLSITALVVTGAFRANKALNKATPINGEQAVKFANYFLSRRSVQTAKGAHLLIEALKTLSSSKEIAPICIQLIGNGQLQAESPLLTISVVDLLGKALAPAPQSVVGKVLTKTSNAVLAEKVQFVSKSSDKTTFVADLSSHKPARGAYVADISVDNVFKQKIQLKVLGRVKVQSLEVGVAENEAGSAVKKHNVDYPKTLPESLIADNTQKLVLKAMLVEEGSGKAITVHQAFVRLYNKESGEEIIFVAEQDSSKAYKFDMDVGARSGDFNHHSGDYELYLIVGDASLSNSFQWHVANVQLKFAHEPKEEKKQFTRSPLPEIEHQFRTPEKRPPRIVSDVFTGLCLTPLVLLFIFWAKLGINVSNFTFAPSTIGFHLGFGGILTLFGLLWWKLNMFQTLRWLIPIGILTFLCGNRLLRRIYTQRTSKSNINPSS